MPKQVTVHTTDDTAAEFDRLFAEATAQNPDLKKGQFLAELLKRYSEPKNTNQGDVDLNLYVLKKEAENKTSKLRNALSKEFIRISNALDISEISNTDEIIAEIRATQQRAMSALKEPNTVEVQRPLEENEILFSIPEPYLSILKETAKRLGEKLNRTVTLRDLFLDVPVRYVVEMRNEWFFPFVIKASEFKNICGYDHKELKLWLNRKPEA